MANSNITPTWITKESLAILAEKLNFCRNIHDGFTGEFGDKTYQKGQSIQIRKPAQYKGRSGAALQVEDHVEQEVTLVLSEQEGVDNTFTSVELSYDIDNFSDRVLAPMMNTLADRVETKVLELAGGFSVINGSGTSGEVVYRDYALAKAYLDNLAVESGNRFILIDTIMQVEIIDQVKSFFQAPEQISKAYLEGTIGANAGFTWYESSRIPLTKTAVTGNDALTVTSISGNSIVVGGAGADTTVIEAGTIFALNANLVHPQNKKSLAGQVAHVVVQSDAEVTTNAATLDVGIALISSGTDARQNIDAAPTTLTIVAEGKRKSLALNKDAMTFAAPALMKPAGTDKSSSESIDNLSLRYVRDYDISDDTFPARFDIVFGMRVVRPEGIVTLIEG
jgi:hypothetical protein